MEAIIWYLSWPVLIFVTWRFVWLNVQHNQKMEKLAAYEKDSKRQESIHKS